MNTNNEEKAIEEDKESHCYLHTGESVPYDEVGHPIDEHGDGHGAGARSLGEQLRRDEPWNGTGTHREEHHEAERRYHWQVAHPINHFLHIPEELLSGDSNDVLSRHRPEEEINRKHKCSSHTRLSVCLSITLHKFVLELVCSYGFHQLVPVAKCFRLSQVMRML